MTFYSNPIVRAYSYRISEDMFIPFFTWPRAKVKVYKYSYYLLLWSDFSSCLLWVSPLGVLALPLGQKILSHRFFWTLKWRDLHFLLASLLQPTFCLLTLKKLWSINPTSETQGCQTTLWSKQAPVPNYLFGFVLSITSITSISLTLLTPPLMSS